MSDRVDKALDRLHTFFFTTELAGGTPASLLEKGLSSSGAKFVEQALEDARVVWVELSQLREMEYGSGQR